MPTSRGSERLLQKYLKEALCAVPQTSTPTDMHDRDTCHLDAVAQRGQIPSRPNCVLQSQSPPLLLKLMSHDSSNVFLWLQNHFA